MKIKITASFLLLASLIFSCGDKSSKKYFAIPKNNAKDIQYEALEFDTIRLKNIETSYVGFIKIKTDTIYFVDKKFKWVFVFDKNGIFSNRFLGEGGGPKEINTGEIVGYESLERGHFFVGPGNDCHIFNQNFEREKEYVMEKANKKQKNEGIKNISADMDFIYTLSYPKLKLKNHKGFIYFNVYSEHPEFNFFKTPEDYFKQSRIIAKMDLETGKIESMLGRYSPVYSNYKNLRQFSLISFDITEKGDFYVCQEADSLIYVYDNNYTSTGAFGYKGKDMDLNYKTITSGAEFKELYKDEREKRGYYDWIEYINEMDLVFRSYKKGGKSKKDGLQIYKNQILIADVNVPKNFRVEGYVAPYFYSHAFIDEEKESIHVLKFKLDGL